MRIDRSTPKVPKHAVPSTNQPSRPAADSYNPSSQYALKQPDFASQYRTDSQPRQQSYSSQVPQPHAPYSNPPLQQQQQKQLPQYAAAAAAVASRPREGEYSTPTIDVKLDTSVCYAFQRGKCKYGDKCMYSHDLSKLGPSFDNRVHGYNAPRDTQYPSVAAASLQDEYIPEGLSYVARLSTYGAGSVYGGGGSSGGGGGESVKNAVPPSTHAPDREAYSAQQGRGDAQQGARASAYDTRPSGPQSYQPPVPQQQYQSAHSADQGYSSRPPYGSSDHQSGSRDDRRRDAPAPSRYDPTPSHQQQPSQQPMSKYGPTPGIADRSYSSHQPPRSDSSSYNPRSADSRDSSSRYGPGGGSGDSSRSSGDRDRGSSGSGYHNPSAQSSASSSGARSAPGMSKYSAPNYAQY